MCGTRLALPAAMKPLLALSLVSLAGCGTTATYTALAPHPYGGYALQPEDVALLTQAPQREHTEIGIIEAGEASVYAEQNTEAIFRRLRVEGAKRRCDAVVIRGANHKAEYDLFLEGTDSVDGWWGSCLVYTRGRGRKGRSLSPVP